ncbi:oligoendopeptidase F [Oenococcus sicerae]|uniref:Oligopeptidase F n=1 Tax=Oenococcus sicerae TaxID=2203724 RepID=A0AAJ1RBE7_9LACO|nr:oligoendopeptidase F [Oenococcus sicerae]MDN6899820.1 oligoendopeptidase F [Oenococcus sicerae]
MAELKARSTFQEKYKWDLRPLFADENAYLRAISDVLDQINEFQKNFDGHLKTLDDFQRALKVYEQLGIAIDQIANYGFMPQSSDFSDEKFGEVAHAAQDFTTKASVALSFWDDALVNADPNVLNELSQEPQYQELIRKTKLTKKTYLGKDIEKTISNLQSALETPYDVYTKLRAGDYHMADFQVAGKNYPNSFVSYENFYQNDENAEIREASFRSFSQGLRANQNAAAATYLNQVTNEKTLSEMRGYDSVFDYLLAPQEVDRSMFDRQIDLIMTDFAPVAQKYLKHVAQVNRLSKLSFADWKLDIDPELNPEVSIEDSYDYVMKATAQLGDEYSQTIKNFLKDRWVDFPANTGKDSGGYTTFPYGVHPFILMSWTGRLSDVYTLIHEIGHAGQGALSAKNQSYYNYEPSTYYVEAASTFNELLLSDYLENQSDDPRTKRFALAHRLSDTYFHNFITHLTEAAFQREVYTLIDQGGSFNADKLNQIMKHVLSTFWGDAVEIDDDAALTWMRQAHYYMGLYSYTYSAGLTISTQGFINLKNDPEKGRRSWLDFLKLGGSKAPIEAAKIAAVDVTTDVPLRNTIQFLSDTVDKIIAYSDEI